MDIPTFEQLHVVSDLHMGGGKGFQIFQQGDRLAALIRTLKEKKNKRLCLILNGDVVDFLAEKPFHCLDPDGAVGKLQRICEDKSFVMVWEALGQFVRTPEKHLVINLGNHDVELALPHVQRWLVYKLAGNDDAARGRITMAVDGAGYRCSVGDKQVLCLHGNEVDGWNPVDFKQLLNLARAINRGKSKKPEWDANAGTRLVIEVMNKIKEEYRFVDLLKPEVEVLIPTLVALEPAYLKYLDESFPLYVRAKIDKERLERGVLAVEAGAEEVEPAKKNPLMLVLQDSFGEHVDFTPADDIDALLDSAHQRIEKDVDPMDSLGEASAESLGLIGYFSRKLRQLRNWIKGNEEEALREGLLAWISKNAFYEPDYLDDTYKDLDKEVGPELDYLIAGHTHLARAIERSSPGRFYYNSGTWAGLIKLTTEELENRETFHDIYTKLKANNIKDLISYDCNVVSIIQDNGIVCGTLNLAQDDGSLEPVPDTEFPRGK